MNINKEPEVGENPTHTQPPVLDSIGTLLRDLLWEFGVWEDLTHDQHIKLTTTVRNYCNKQVVLGRIAEHGVILDRYAKLYNKISKEHGVKQPVPHTAFHQISADRISELKAAQPHKGKEK